MCLKLLFGTSSSGAPRPLSLFLWLQLHPALHLQMFDDTNCSRHFLSLRCLARPFCVSSDQRWKNATRTRKKCLSERGPLIDVDPTLFDRTVSRLPKSVRARKSAPAVLLKQLLSTLMRRRAVARYISHES